MDKEKKKKMKTQNPSLDALIIQALLEQSDETHLLSMTDLRAFCDYSNHPADRRTVYKAISGLKEANVPIFFVRKNGKQGYYIKHAFTNAEALFLMNACEESSSLSISETEKLLHKIQALMPEKKISQLPQLAKNPTKTEQSTLLKDMERLLPAIAHNYYVEFRYFDLTVTKKKKYRRENQKYRLVPYALVSADGRYYVVFYSEKHQSFANYRLDKMDAITITDEPSEGIPFSLQDHMRTSFRMYHGNPQTVTATFDNSMASLVFDQFGDDIVISQVDEQSFTASIRTAVTPTLVSWFLQFYDKVIIKKPVSLIQEYQKIAQQIMQTYPIEKKAPHGK